MRVIAGKYRGHRLTSFQADHIRPTTDRTKESIFNVLTAAIPDALVLDLFSGSGSLAIEALSRGARHVVAVESHPKSLKIIKENLAKLKIEASDFSLQPVDVFKFLGRYQGEPFDVILLDPPFTQKLAHDAMVALSAAPAVWHAQTDIVIEAGPGERLDDRYDKIVMKKIKEFGDKKVAFFACE